jgi:hypothetical protein
MWDTKRQVIWLTTAIALATFVVYQNALDETGRLDLGYFALLELIFITVIAIMFFIYSRKSKK